MKIREKVKSVSVGVTPNGVYYYTHYGSPNFVSGVGVRSGSLHDPRNAMGMNHLREHLKGWFPPDVELKFEEYGCGPDEAINIRVDRSSTFYGHGDLVRRRFMQELFELFAGGVFDPAKITPEALEREKAAVFNEYFLHGKDYLENSVDDLIHALMYEETGNPAGSRIDCEPEQLKAITVRDVKRFCAVNDGADTAFVVLTGVPHLTAKRLVEERLEYLKPTNRPPLAVPVIRPQIKGPRYVEVEKRGIHQHHVVVAFPTFNYGHKDDLPLDVLGYIWQWRVRQALREANRDWGKGTYRVFVYTPRTFAHGMIYIWFATPSREFADEGAQTILAECAKLRDEFAEDGLIKAFRNKLHNLYVDAFESFAEKLCEMIVEATCNGDPEMIQLNSYLDHLKRVGKKAVRRVANEYMDPNAYVHLVIRPDVSAEPNEKVITDSWREVQDVKRPEPLVG